MMNYVRIGARAKSCGKIWASSPLAHCLRLWLAQGTYSVWLCSHWWYTWGYRCSKPGKPPTEAP
eukprot:4258354-Amphidinium_carterae.1